MAKILLVEDDKSLREIYGVRLMAEGYEIVSAGDGEEALAMAIKEHPDLIVSDVMMPKISGFDMLDILRSTTETKGVKVIMMTALSSEDQRARGEALGADRYLVKSQVGIEDVVRTVHEVLGDGPATFAATPAFAGTSTTSDAPATAPAPTPPSFSQPSVLPEPTAPFSSPRPGGSEGEAGVTTPTDFGALINQELTTSIPAPEPVTQPAAEPTATPDPLVAPTTPAEPVQPTQPTEPVAATPAPAPIEMPTPAPAPMQPIAAPVQAPTPTPAPSPLPPVINAAPAPMGPAPIQPTQPAQPTPPIQPGL